MCDKLTDAERITQLSLELALVKAELDKANNYIAIGRSWNTPDSLLQELDRLKIELNTAKALLQECLSQMPCGYIPNHTVENLPKMISDLAKELAEITSEYETLKHQNENTI